MALAQSEYVGMKFGGWLLKGFWHEKGLLSSIQIVLSRDSCGKIKYKKYSIV